MTDWIIQWLNLPLLHEWVAKKLKFKDRFNSLLFYQISLSSATSSLSYLLPLSQFFSHPFSKLVFWLDYARILLRAPGLSSTLGLNSQNQLQFGAQKTSYFLQATLGPNSGSHFGTLFCLKGTLLQAVLPHTLWGNLSLRYLLADRMLLATSNIIPGSCLGHSISATILRAITKHLATSNYMRTEQVATNKVACELHSAILSMRAFPHHSEHKIDLLTLCSKCRACFAASSKRAPTIHYFAHIFPRGCHKSCKITPCFAHFLAGKCCSSMCPEFSFSSIWS